MPEDAQHRRGEVASIRERVKADEVRAEHPLEDLLAPRQDAQHLRRGEGDVQEEADRRAGMRARSIRGTSESW